MNTTTPHLTDAPAQSADPGPIASPSSRDASPNRPTWGKTFVEAAPIIDTPAFYGPPIIFVLGPWLLLVLVAIGPVALVLTLVLVLAVAAGLLAACVAVIASPFLLIRHFHSHGLAHGEPRATLQPFRKHRVSSGRLGSPQPGGAS